MAQARRADRSFFIITLLLTLAGFFIFYSASLGLISRTGAQFNSVALKQLVIMVVGLGAFFVVSKLNYQGWQKHSWLVFLISLILTLLVFVPGLGFEAGGAKRWILIGGMSVQTSEFLKLGYVLYLANWLSRKKDAAQSFREGIVPFMVITAIVGIAMVAQPDMSTLGIMLASGVAMLYVAGAKWKHLGLLALLGIVALGGVIAMKPYTQARIKTFFHPEENQLGSSYQVNQSLIAIGSGGVTGRGFGQSIQKFKYLPEPIGDSIFSVAAEEFGFIGSLALVALFLGLALSGLKVAARSTNQFGRLAAVGIVIMILAGVFINIASMVGLMPLNGTPLLFISQGGTALLLVLIEAGIILNISKYLPRQN
jgi:cell division protein FtsW